MQQETGAGPELLLAARSVGGPGPRNLVTEGPKERRHLSASHDLIATPEAVLARVLAASCLPFDRARMLAHFCERAAQGDETARVAVEVMRPELRGVLDRLQLQ